MTYLNTKPYEAKPKPNFLRFSAYAWAKLEFWRKKAKTEVGCFGLSLETSPLTVFDVQIVKQKSSIAYTEFDDAAIADYFEDMVKLEYRPAEFARIWIHTHPGGSASPSSKDEETLKRCFGGADWSVMCIFAEGEQYARLQVNKPFVLQVPLQVKLDMTLPFDGSEHDDWQQDLEDNVTEKTFSYANSNYGSATTYVKNRNGFYERSPYQSRLPSVYANCVVDSDFVSPDELAAAQQEIADLLAEPRDTCNVSRAVYSPKKGDIVFHDVHGQCIVDDVYAGDDVVDLTDSDGKSIISAFTTDITPLHETASEARAGSRLVRGDSVYHQHYGKSVVDFVHPDGEKVHLIDSGDNHVKDVAVSTLIVLSTEEKEATKGVAIVC